MHSRVLASLGAASTIALVATASLPVSGQSATPALVITAYNGGAPTPYTVPKTPWGDPGSAGRLEQRRRDDADVAATEFRRPPLSERRGVRRATEADSERCQATRENAVGSFRGDFARRAFRQTSLIVDPPDGSTPAFTAEAQKRRAPARSGHVRRRTVQFDRGLHALRPLHHARHRRIGAARRLRQRQPHRPGANSAIEGSISAIQWNTSDFRTLMISTEAKQKKQARMEKNLTADYGSLNVKLLKRTGMIHMGSSFGPSGFAYFSNSSSGNGPNEFDSLFRIMVYRNHIVLKDPGSSSTRPSLTTVVDLERTACTFWRNAFGFGVLKWAAGESRGPVQKMRDDVQEVRSFEV